MSNFVCDFQRRTRLYKRPLISCWRQLERRWVPADDYYDRFRRTPAEDFYKKPVLCAAHVVGIADPVKYRKRLEAVQAIQRQQEDWSVRLKSDGPSYPEMYRKSYNSQELFNKELQRQREEDQIRGTKVGDMDHATSGKGQSNEVGEPRGLKEKLIDQIRAIQADRRNAQAMLAYERAKFHADCVGCGAGAVPWTRVGQGSTGGNRAALSRAGARAVGAWVRGRAERH